jgi:hypothetical protein
MMLGISALVLAALVAILIFKGRPQKPKEEPCPGPSVERLMKDRWMGRSLPQGSKFRFLPNWYACHSAERDELVLYRFSSEREPVVRRVVGVPGDHFEWVEDKAHKSWNLMINGKPIHDSEKKVHFVLNLNGKNDKGLLGPKNYIVVTRVSPSVLDSGVFGVVSSDDFLGKVEPVQSK